MAMLTQELLKLDIHYCPETGVFTRIRRQGIAMNKITGCIGNHGYLIIGVNYKTYLAHRLAFFYMTGKWPKHTVDHINRDKKDNRWINLRNCVQSQNSANTSIHKKNSSGTSGICFKTLPGKWEAKIMKDGISHFIGLFSDLEEAKIKHKQKSLELYGEYSPYAQIKE